MVFIRGRVEFKTSVLEAGSSRVKKDPGVAYRFGVWKHRPVSAPYSQIVSVPSLPLAATPEPVPEPVRQTKSKEAVNAAVAAAK
jgi:hypothetical protein